MDSRPIYDKSKTDPILITIIVSLSILLVIIFIFVYVKHSEIRKKEKIIDEKLKTEFYDGLKKRGINRIEFLLDKDVFYSSGYRSATWVRVKEIYINNAFVPFDSVYNLDFLLYKKCNKYFILHTPGPIMHKDKEVEVIGGKIIISFKEYYNYKVKLINGKLLYQTNESLYGDFKRSKWISKRYPINCDKLRKHNGKVY